MLSNDTERRLLVSVTKVRFSLDFVGFKTLHGCQTEKWFMLVLDVLRLCLRSSQSDIMCAFLLD